MTAPLLPPPYNDGIREYPDFIDTHPETCFVMTTRSAVNMCSSAPGVMKCTGCHNSSTPPFPLASDLEINTPTEKENDTDTWVNYIKYQIYNKTSHKARIFFHKNIRKNKWIKSDKKILNAIFDSITDDIGHCNELAMQFFDEFLELNDIDRSNEPAKSIIIQRLTLLINANNLNGMADRARRIFMKNVELLENNGRCDISGA